MKGSNQRKELKRAAAPSAQRMAELSLEALHEAEGLDVEVRCIYIRALIEDNLLPGALIEDAEPERFKALVEMMTARAFPETSSQDH